MDTSKLETEKTKVKQPDIVDRYLEIDKLYADGITLKHMADNLRSYPVIVLFWFAIRYLWANPSSAYISSWVLQLMAIIWGLWIVWFAFLTATQSALLIAGVVADVCRPWYRERPRLRSVVIIFVGILAALFMGGSIYIAEGLLNSVRR